MKTFLWANIALCCVLLTLFGGISDAAPVGAIPAGQGTLKLTPFVNGTSEGGRGIPPGTCPGNDTSGAYATAVTLQTDAAGILTGINFTCSDGSIAAEQSGNSMPQLGGTQNLTRFQNGAGQGGFIASVAYIYNGIIGGISFNTINGSSISAGVMNSSTTAVPFNLTGPVVGLETVFAPPVGSYAAGTYWSRIALAYR